MISYSFLTQLWIYCHRISLSGDIELNIGPKPDFSQCFSVRMDHRSNKKREVCAFTTNIPLKVIDASYLRECIKFDVEIGDKTCNFVNIYRSPSQTKDEFENFTQNLELNFGTHFK